MPALHLEVKAAVASALEKAAYISLTTDIWTNASNTPFISLTGHFIDKEEFKQVVVTLTTKPFSDSHTAVKIGEMLTEIMTEWNIGEQNVHVIVHDNAANMVRASELIQVDSLCCFLHTLQLAINDAIFSQRAVKDIIAKCKTIVGHFAHSALACEKLKQLQISHNLPQHKLIQDVSTRWNSTLHMLERVYEQRQAISAYSLDHDLPILSGPSYTLMANVIRAIKPFEEVTLLSSQEKEIASCILPTVSTLKSYLSKQQKDAGVQTLKQA